MPQCLKCKCYYEKYGGFASKHHVSNILCFKCQNAWFKYAGLYLRAIKKDVSELFEDFLADVTPIPLLNKVC